MAFCTNCGATIPDGSKFCGECGAVQGAAPVPAPTQQTTARKYTPADEVDYTIYGDDMQMVEIELDPGETVIAEAGAMNYMDSNIKMETIFGDGSGADEGKGLGGKLLSGAKRALTGESLFMTTFQNTGSGKAHLAFAASTPGKIIPVELSEFANSLICQKSAFLCAAKGVNIDLYLQKKIGAGLFGGEGFIMQKLTGDGLVFLNAGGTIIKKELAAGEQLRLDTGCLVAISDTVDYDVQFASDIKSGFLGGEGLFLATVTGPGHVWLQSLPLSRMADEIIKASRGSTGENKGFNNPINEVTGGLGDALGGLFKL
ncbi:MAG TPA: TIGR00266 family protein [Anaerovoracaceae bacterium]|nr:TIGR00266 family protein [Anaerovoracaceae bacterium]